MLIYEKGDQPGADLYIKLHGKINERGTSTLLDYFSQMPTGVRAVMVDLSRVTLISGTGIGGLIGLRHKLAANGVAMRLTGMPELIDQLFHQLQLHGIFES